MKDLDAFKQVALSVRSLTDLSRHYGLPLNGKQGRWFAETLRLVGLDKTIYAETWHAPSPFPMVERTCPCCDKSFTVPDGGKRGEQRYCSQRCANRTHPPRTIEQKKQTSRSLKALHAHKAKEQHCEYCKKSMGFLMPHLYGRRRFCSNACARKVVNQDPEYRAKISAAQKRLVKEGRHKGWLVRGRAEDSYAEKFFMRVLTERGIEYQREIGCNGYWIDFAILLDNGIKIALEVDGKQHSRWERERVDRRKTISLESKGWNVYRIPWVSVNTDKGKDQMKRFLDEFQAYCVGLSDNFRTAVAQQ